MWWIIPGIILGNAAKNEYIRRTSGNSSNDNNNWGFGCGCLLVVVMIIAFVMFFSN